MDINGDAPEIVGRVRRTPNFRLRSTPERLLNAALDEFIRLRFDKVRVEHITGRLGLTKTALYAHFANKRAIFDRVIEEFCLPADGTQ
jgi:AcrR family transcriptional regulator